MKNFKETDKFILSLSKYHFEMELTELPTAVQRPLFGEHFTKYFLFVET